MKVYLADATKLALLGMPTDDRRIVGNELKSLPQLDHIGGHLLKGVDHTYRALTLPSGYRIVYRRLSGAEQKELTNQHGFFEDDAYLIADLEPGVTAAVH